ncbi:MAG: aromatic ring-hydroxylating dioxygenase subunit alpha [Alphaproteobacteria bacterium]|nr:aromatic ring-hydroxylating dioxygenase subunit alpha [Alphaproteobacteria bacterium]
MLATGQAILRRFWYPAIPVERLADGPKPFRLLGRDLVLWRDAGGRVAAMDDRCCHRSAKLSRGFVDGALLVCGYHGWAFDGQGQCRRVPQFGEQAGQTRYRVPSYRAETRYDYVWVCLEDPLYPIPDLPEHAMAGYRTIHQFYESWDCAGLRVMENSFDNAHFAFVHRASFGDQGHPVPAKLELEFFDQGFVMRSDVPVVNPEIQMKNLGMTARETVRHMTATWWMPFMRKLHIRYPNGLVHCIVTVATPIEDSRSQICQWVYRNDREDQVPAAQIIAFDRQVTQEDIFILETTDPDVPLELQGAGEAHMPSDRPGVEMRKRLKKLLADHGESEARAAQGPGPAQAAE